MTHVADEQLAAIEQLPERLAALAECYSSGTVASLIPILPMLSLKGEPYSIVNYAPFEPLYRLQVPRRMYFKCGRQIAKSTNMSSQSVLQSAVVPHFATLFVAPRFEQIRRISSNYVRPFIEHSLIAQLLQNKSVVNGVLQRSFLNSSQMYFSYAFLDAERIRGLSVDATNYDEIQDIDTTFLPIIRECMSASNVGLERYYGTPKTMDNTLEALWDQSSQAEWFIRCAACNYDNIPSIKHHLAKMIGQLGPVCANCGRLVNPRLGRWVHTEPDRMMTDAGYHIPQIIMPMHYEDPAKPGQIPTEASEKWVDLRRKMDGQLQYDATKFSNEVLGESSDIGVRLVTLTDIKNVSVLNKNERRAALDRIREYRLRVLAVDWSGGGEDFISTTTYCVIGLHIKTGKTDCIYTKRASLAASHQDEAKLVLDEFRAFQCHMLAHDAAGAGAIRETLLIQAGLPLNKIMACVYIRASTKKMVERHQQRGERPYYQIDKARSLVLQASAIKAQTIRLPEYASSKDLTSDLLALYEDTYETPGGSDVFLVRRNPKLTDDFAQALNIGCIAAWHVTNSYPDLSRAMAIKLTPSQSNFAAPPNVTYD